MSPKKSAERKVEQSKPLNARQKVFGRELGVAMAAGSRNFEAAYETAGYARHRGNAARLAANPEVTKIADEACAKALRLSGLHIGYLQAKGLSLLDATATNIQRRIAKHLIRDATTGIVKFGALTEDDEAELDAATWAVSKLKIDKDGVIAIEIPDKKGLIEMLAKMIGSIPDETAAAIDGLGDRLDRAIQRVAAA